MTDSTVKMDFITSSNTNVRADDLEGDITTKDKRPNSVKPIQTTSIPAIIKDTQLEMTSPNDGLPVLSTLDEPVSVTIKRDVKAVAYKFGHVFFPKKSSLLLRDWDLWGPLFLCVLLAVSLQGSSSDVSAPQFANVFALIALGAIIITVNIKLLAGKISFFQSICVLGYCLLPLVLVSILNILITSAIDSTKSFPTFLIRCLLVFGSFGWSVFASTAFLAADTMNLTDRKTLAIYPIFLFYFVISWLIILDAN